MAAYFESRAIVLHAADDLVSIETESLHEFPDQAVCALIAIARALPPDLAAIWRDCGRRTFNLGFKAGSEPRLEEHLLSSETIAAVAEMKAEIAITLYAATD